MENNFGNLEQIIVEMLRRTFATQKFDFGLFLQQMEYEFTRRGYREPARGVCENILLVRLDNIGDFILTIPAIREIRMNYPAAFITLVVRERVYPVAELCPYVNEVLIFNENLLSGDPLQIIFNVAGFSKKFLWHRRYDLGFTFRYWNDNWRLDTLYMLYLSGTARRVSYINEPININEANKKPDLSPILLTHPFKIPKEIRHDCARNLYLLKSFGLSVRNTSLEIWYNKTDLYIARQLLGKFGEGRIKVAVGIGASVSEKKYPPEKYLTAFKQIIDKGASLIIFGGHSELDDAKFLEDNLPKEFVKSFVEVNAGWRVDIAAMSLTDMYIGNFTGACDIAAALNKPVIALSRVAKDFKNFYNGINEAELYRPWQTDSIILQPNHQLEECTKTPNFVGCDAGKPHCIAQIEPSEIVDAFDKMVSFIRKDIKFFDGDFDKYLDR